MASLLLFLGILKTKQTGKAAKQAIITYQDYFVETRVDSSIARLA